MRIAALFIVPLVACNDQTDTTVYPAPLLRDPGEDTQALEDNIALQALEDNIELKACAAVHLGIESDTSIDAETALTLNHLDCIDEGISSLDGIHLFENLKTLSLWENAIDDLAPLEELTQLVWLELGNNKIQDLSPIANLTDLERLGLSSNRVSDIEVLSNFSKMKWLNLDDNTIENVDALADLQELTWLTIEHNTIDNMTVIDEVAANGADVYHQNQTSSPSSTMDAGMSGTLDVNVVTLSPRFGDEGTVEFDLLVADKLFPVHSEFSGKIVTENGQLFLYRNAQRIAVGHTDGSVASLCENTHTCQVTIGVKTAPASAYDGLAPDPIVTLALSVMPMPGDEDETYGQSDETLVDYVLASPNQFDAGSCLFMTTTGAMELLMHQHTDLDSVEYNGDTDLSERFLMTAYQDVPSSTLRYWLTDTVYTYNYFGGSMLNRDYPFTAGYVRETRNGLVPCDSDDSGAYYSCSYNWFDERPNDWESLMVDTPPVDRTVAFADPERSSSSQWNVGLMDDEDVEKIKYMLRTRRAPIVVIYNHYLYWHADLIVGYDDTVSTDGCPMVESSMDYFNDEGASGYTQRIESHMDDIGDCTSQGIFYVRDSIYEGGSDEETYEYSSGFSEKYSKRIIERTYNWVKYLGNHAYSIHRK